jgi:hypothetical protein
MSSTATELVFRLGIGKFKAFLFDGKPLSFKARHKEDGSRVNNVAIFFLEGHSIIYDKLHTFCTRINYENHNFIAEVHINIGRAKYMVSGSLVFDPSQPVYIVF